MEITKKTTVVKPEVVIPAVIEERFTVVLSPDELKLIAASVGITSPSKRKEFLDRKNVKLSNEDGIFSLELYTKLSDMAGIR